MEEKKRGLKKFIKNNLISLIVVGIIIFLPIVIAGNVIVNEGNLEIENMFNASGVLYINSDSSEVGIGTSEPLAELDVRGYIWNINKVGDASKMQFKTYLDSAYCSEFSFHKSRNSTIGVSSETLNGDRLGVIDFYGVNSNNEGDWVASLQILQSGNATATSVPTKFSFLTSNGTDDPEEIVKIDDDGITIQKADSNFYNPNSDISAGTLKVLPSQIHAIDTNPADADAHTLDVSSFVPAGTKVVLITTVITESGGADRTITFYNESSGNVANTVTRISNYGQTIAGWNTFPIPLYDGHNIYWEGNNADIDNFQVRILGYWI